MIALVRLRALPISLEAVALVMKFSVARPSECCAWPEDPKFFQGMMMLEVLLGMVSRKSVMLWKLFLA